jgi:hypothetical protein
MSSGRPESNVRRELFPRDFKRIIEDFAWPKRLFGSAVLVGGPNQLFKSALIRLSNSSNEVSPLILSPLRKKVGVEFTFSTSAAYF